MCSHKFVYRHYTNIRTSFAHKLHWWRDSWQIYVFALHKWFPKRRCSTGAGCTRTYRRFDVSMIVMLMMMMMFLLMMMVIGDISTRLNDDDNDEEALRSYISASMVALCTYALSVLGNVLCTYIPVYHLSSSQRTQTHISHMFTQATQALLVCVFALPLFLPLNFPFN